MRILGQLGDTLTGSDTRKLNQLKLSLKKLDAFPKLDEEILYETNEEDVEAETL